MDGIARCSTCFRAERRRDDVVLEVTMPGGGRKPSVPGDLAAWRTWRDVAAGDVEVPVGKCEACGQPMFCVEGELPKMERWAFTLPDGVIVVGPGGVEGGGDEDADRRMEEHYREAAEAKLTNGQFGFAIVLAVLGFAIAAIVGVCECPTMAMAVAVPMGVRAAEQGMRQNKGRTKPKGKG